MAFFENTASDLGTGTHLFATDETLETYSSGENFPKNGFHIEPTAIQETVTQTNRGALRIAFEAPVFPDAAPPRPSRKDSVDGAVLKIGDVSVLCEVYTSLGEKRISLPRPLFPGSLWKGWTFSMRIREEMGYRGLEIIFREPKPLTIEEENELQSLMDCF